MKKTYDAQKAIEIQISKNNHFIPANGVCFSCRKNIFLPSEKVNNGVKYTVDYSVEDSEETFICGCPHCYRSFVD